MVATGLIDMKDRFGERVKKRLDKIDWLSVVLVVAGLALLALISWLFPGFDYPKVGGGGKSPQTEFHYIGRFHCVGEITKCDEACESTQKNA